MDREEYSCITRCSSLPIRVPFFKMAMKRMENEMKQKKDNTKKFQSFVF